MYKNQKYYCSKNTYGPKETPVLSLGHLWTLVSSLFVSSGCSSGFTQF